MRLQPGARLAIVGAGPGGLATAKHALEAGFTVTVFEASDDLGGQWYTTAPHSGIWPGMRTNTSRMMTGFSDFPPPAEHELYPLAEQVQAYLRDYAAAFDGTERIRLQTRVTTVEKGWLVNGEHFDAVVVASGRFRAPRTPEGLGRFTGELLHSFDYPGAEAFRGRRVLVYGNGVSGHEIASDCATVTQVVSAYRKPRYVLQKSGRGRAVGLALVHPRRRHETAQAGAGGVGGASSAIRWSASPAIQPTSGHRLPMRTSSSPGTRCARITSRRSGKATSSAAPASLPSTATW